MPGDDRKDLAVQALARSATVSDLSTRHGVSRKFVYRQANKARHALDDAFLSAATDDTVLFQIQVTKRWLRQVIVAPAILNSVVVEVFRCFGSVFGGLKWRDGVGMSSRWSYRRRGDGLQEVGPVLEDDVGGDGPQMLEEAIRGAAGDDGGAPGEDAEISGGVECEGEQIEGDQNAGEGFLAVAKVVFEVVSVGLEHVESLVVSRPEGFHLRPLAERCVNLSAHTAPIRRTRR